MNINWLLLSNTMSSILSLDEDSRRPEQLSEYDGWSRCESEASAESGDAEQSHPDFGFLLELIHLPLSDFCTVLTI